MTNFADISTVSNGTKLVADGGFTCIEDGAVLTVSADEHGKFHVPCSHGQHYLDGQLDGRVYVGLSPAE